MGLFTKSNNIVISSSSEKIIETVDISKCGSGDTFTVAPGCKVIKIVDGIRKPDIIDNSKGKKTKIFEHGETAANTLLLAMNSNVNYTINWGTGELVYKARGVDTKDIGLRGEVKFRAVQFTSLIDKGIYDATPEKIRADLFNEIVSIAKSAFAELSAGVKVNEITAIGEKISVIIKGKLPDAADSLGYPIVIESVTTTVHVPDSFWNSVFDDKPDRLFGDALPTDETSTQASLLEKWGTASHATVPEQRVDDASICPKCNAQRIPGSLFCNRCGKKF